MSSTILALGGDDELAALVPSPARVDAREDAAADAPAEVFGRDAAPGVELHRPWRHERHRVAARRHTRHADRQDEEARKPAFSRRRGHSTDSACGRASLS